MHPEASQEFLDAIHWYRNRSVLLGREFQAEFDRAVTRIEDAPSRWPVGDRNTRRVQIHRFPYLIFYRIMEDTIRIIAVAHSKRRPTYWHQRR